MIFYVTNFMFSFVTLTLKIKYLIFDLMSVFGNVLLTKVVLFQFELLNTQYIILIC